MRETEEKYISLLTDFGCMDYNCLFKKTAISKFSNEELCGYENSLKAYCDKTKCVDAIKWKKIAEGYAEDYAELYAEGYVEGCVEVRTEVTKRLLTMGLPIEDIAKATGLSIDEIKSI